MKISIVAFNNLNRSPYVNIYADFCKANGIEYEIIYPDRDNSATENEYCCKPLLWNAKKNKFINFLCFRKETIKHLKKSKSDFIIVLTTMPAVLLSGYLTKRYRGRYLVDVRDYTYEGFKPYFLIEKLVMKYAAMRVVSSPGFVKFLPKAEYSLCHNMNAGYAKENQNEFVPASDPIIIGYVGTIAYKNQCVRLMKLVEKDPRFCFHFYGDEGADRRISDYLKEKPCERVKMFGAYKPSEKLDILSRVDILFNVYGFGNNLVDYALSNKLYDSFYIKKPILTSPKTAMSEEAGEFSYDIDFEKTDNLDGLYAWYRGIDADAFGQYSKEYMDGVIKSQKQFYEKLTELFVK